MKKIILLLMCTSMFTSCEIEEDDSGLVQVYAEVVDTNLPETFVMGKLYTIDVTYLLPDACHVGLSLYATRGGSEGDNRREIYIAGIASRPVIEVDCTKEDEELEKEGSFFIRVDEDEPFTFYLWNGVDENGKDVYTEVVVPVVEAASPTTE